MGWLGVIETPDWSAGITLGNFGVSTSNLVSLSTATKDRNAGSSEGSFNDQPLFVHFDNVLSSQNEQAVFVGTGFLSAIFLTDQLGGIVIRRLPPTAMPFMPARRPLSFKERLPLSLMLL
jgi:hypothetical protein